MKQKNLRIIFFGLVLCMIVPFLLSAAGEKEAVEKERAPFDIAVFVPGVTAGSPLYEQMANGTKKAVEEYENASVKILEAGFNQAEWQEKMTSLAATMEYELIVTSNPAMPFIIAEVAKDFPDQKFLNLDAYYKGLPALHTVLYNQVEQAYFAGYMAGLVTTSNMKGANADLKVGMIVAQEYPALTKMMKPGYIKGFSAVNDKITLDYRVIGNWYDATKASDLANSMFDEGVDIILTIAGGAGQGVINASKERGKYVLYFDDNVYHLAPGTIVGCSILRQEKLAQEKIKAAIEGKLEYGTAQIVDTRAGYVDWAGDDPLYVENVPEEIRKKMDDIVKKIKSKEIKLEVPEL